MYRITFLLQQRRKKVIFFFFKRKETDPFGKEGQRNEKCTFCCRASIMAPFSGFCSAVVLRYFLRKTKTKCKIYFRQFFLFFFFFIEAVLHSSTKVLVEVFFFVQFFSGRQCTIGIPLCHHDDGLSVAVTTTPLLVPRHPIISCCRSGVPRRVPLRTLHADHATADARSQVTRLESLRLGLPVGAKGKDGYAGDNSKDRLVYVKCTDFFFYETFARTCCFLFY